MPSSSSSGQSSPSLSCRFEASQTLSLFHMPKSRTKESLWALLLYESSLLNGVDTFRQALHSPPISPLH